VAGNAQQVLQSRDIIAYIAPYAASNAMPADSAYGTAPGGTYRDVGYTDGGLGFNVGATFEDVRVDQSIDPVGVIATGRDVRLTGRMAEFTLQNLKDATSQGTLTTTPASSGVRGHTDFTMDNTIGVNYLTALFDVKHALGDGESMRFALWRGQVRSAVAGTISAAAKLVLPFEVQAFPDPNNANRVLTVRDVIAALP
jgi:hypothetical protein